MRSNVEGMNCVCPNAPAHEPCNAPGSMSPFSRMRIALNSSPRKNSCRRPKHDNVDSDCSSGRLPKVLP